MHGMQGAGRTVFYMSDYKFQRIAANRLLNAFIEEGKTAFSGASAASADTSYSRSRSLSA